MKNIDWKKGLPHLVAILLFLGLTITYFSPIMFENKDMAQADLISGAGWGNDAKQFHEETGEYTFWSNAMFGGMPANYAYMPRTNNIFERFSKLVMFNLPPIHVGVVFLYLAGFYIFLLALGANPWLSIIGAIAYGLSSYNIIILEAGHVNKALVMATMAPVLGGILLCYRKKFLWGSLITLFFTGLNVLWNHQQISYYLLLIIIPLAIVYFIFALREKKVKDFFLSSGLLLVIAAIALLPAADRLIPTADYSKETMRGGAVLQQTATGEKSGKSGLDIDYAYQWSYGRLETMTMLIPNFYGASSHYNIGRDSETYEALKQTGQAEQFSKHAPMYWGDQPFTSGPVYMGAIICFLFILGLFVVKGPEKWWILAATIISIILSWGKNFMVVNEFLYNSLPLYNKFRAPSMALVIAGVTMVALAIIALRDILKAEDKKAFIKPLYYSAGITGGLCLLLALLGGSLFSFTSASDVNYPQWLLSAFIEDRQGMLTGDAWRSFFLILLSAGGLWLYLNNKLKASYLMALIGLLVLIDMWTVDKRFLNNDHFMPKQVAKAIKPTQNDLLILQDKDPNYRVLNLSTNTFNESATSYFHKSVGGYSPVKLRRYQDIIDFYLSNRGINMNVLNMLNTKYVIVPTENGSTVQQNPDALGNAWFVDSLLWVDSPDDEIHALGTLNPATMAVVEKTWKENVTVEPVVVGDSASIVMTQYTPGKLTYQSHSDKARVAVFSEVFYKTWRATIDGQPATPIRVNYILRGLEVPAGQHEVVFECVDELYLKSARWSSIGSIFVGVILFSLVGLLIFTGLRKRKETN
ncbi:MAG: YfhO family protein [Bacteroidales bacterium]|nr:YfhO family protein [Bacteroidales bacterium]